MFDFELDATQDEALYQQLYRQLRQMILDGRLPAGQKLPSTRRLAGRLDLGRVTVIQAYEQLQTEGFLRSRSGSGTFVSEKIGKVPTSGDESFNPRFSPWGQRLLSGALPAKQPKAQVEIEFGFGRSFPHIFPYDIWRRLLGRYLSTDDVMLSRYGSPVGYLPLRRALSTYLQRQRGVRCTPEQVFIVSGAQQALDILSRLLLSPGDEILVETPGYTDAFQIFRAHGATLVPRAVDEQGLPVSDLPEGESVRAAFVTPSHQFPRGGTLPMERRLALLRWAREQQALVIEDDYDSELRYDGRPLGALQGLDDSGHVAYLGTFSKVLFPALRLAYAVLPDMLLEPFARVLSLVDRGAPTLTQAAVADFIDEGHFERHLRRLRAAYGERRRVLVHALDAHLGRRVTFSRNAAGLHVMLQLQQGCDEVQVVRRAAEAGVGVYAGAPFYLGQAPPSILLGFSGLDDEQIREGVRRLAAIIPRCGP